MERDNLELRIIQLEAENNALKDVNGRLSIDVALRRCRAIEDSLRELRTRLEHVESGVASRLAELKVAVDRIEEAGMRRDDEIHERISEAAKYVKGKLEGNTNGTNRS